MATKPIQRFWRVSLVLLSIAAGSANAQNLLINPNFHTDLSEWTESRDSAGDCVWLPMFEGGGVNGAADCLKHDEPPIEITRFYLFQNVLVAPGEQLVAEAYHWVPCGQTIPGAAGLELKYIGPQGNPVAPASNCLADGTACGIWNRSRCAEVTVPVAARSVYVGLRLTKIATGGGFRAIFDEIKLLPELVFANGFE